MARGKRSRSSSPTVPVRRIDGRLPRVGHCVMISETRIACWLVGESARVGDEVIYPVVMRATGQRCAGLFRIATIEEVEPDTFVGEVEPVGPLGAGR